MQGPRRSMSQQAINQRMDSAQDVVPGQLRRPAIPRSVLTGFEPPLPVIYSAQPSEAAVSRRGRSLAPPYSRNFASFSLHTCYGEPCPTPSALHDLQQEGNCTRHRLHRLALVDPDDAVYSTRSLKSASSRFEGPVLVIWSRAGH